MTKRSRLMSGVRQKGTDIEEFVAKFLFSKGLRYRKNVKGLPGSPDLLFPKYKVAIFVNGCFWHGHDCHYGKLPKSNRKFWESKMDRNRARDAEKIAGLSKLGYKSIVVWACKLKNKDMATVYLDTIANQIVCNHN